MQMLDQIYSAQFQELFFWLSKQICHPIRKVLERNVKPCKGNNNEHMQSCCAKIFKTINSHNARNDPTNCHVSVTILQMRKHVSLYRGRGFLSVCKDRYQIQQFSLWVGYGIRTPPKTITKCSDSTLTRGCLTAWLTWSKNRTLGISQAFSRPMILIVHLLQQSAKMLKSFCLGLQRERR